MKHKVLASWLVLFSCTVLSAQDWQSVYGAGGALGIFKLWGGKADRSSLSYSGHIEGRYGISPYVMSSIEMGYGTFKPARFGTSTYADANSPFRTFIFPVDLTIRYTPLPANQVKPYALGELGLLFWDLARTGPKDGNVLTNGKLRWGKSFYGMETNALIGFGAGFEWQITDKIALDFQFRGLHLINSKKDNVGENDVNDKYYQFRFSSIYYLNKKKPQAQPQIVEEIKSVELKPEPAVAQPIETSPELQTPPKPVEQPVEPKIQMPEKGGAPLILKGVNFALGSAELTPEAQTILRQVAESLMEHPEVRVRIEGHTDNTGPETFNRWLSLRRAESVKRFLTEQGIAPNRMETVGKGPDFPIADNSTPEGQSLNRRIEFIRLE